MDDSETKYELNIKRNLYSQQQFDANFKNNTKKENISRWSSCFKPFMSAYHPKNFLSLLSILNVIATYKFKDWFVSDIFSGLTVGVMQIPQALAYSSLTSLSPVHGLYTSFFPSLTYVVFGSSRHLSVGTFALVSLMVYGSISRLEEQFTEGKTIIIDSTTEFPSATDSLTEGDLMVFRLKVATALAFWCGIVQILFAIFQFGAITKYLSQPVLRGFNTAAAYHILTAQFQHVFGIYVKPKPSRIFKIIYRVAAIVMNIASINWVALAISVITVPLIVFTKLYLNVKFKKQLKGIPLPIEIVVLILGIVISYYAKLNSKFDLAIVGYIPSGIPTPSVPEFSLFSSVISDAIIISVVAIASSISIGDMYARKHQYAINSNKEIIALGMGNIVGSFFKCFTCGGALARSAVFEASGGKSQFVTVISSSITFLVLVAISGLLQSLPKACLGSIIIGALINLLKQTSDIKHYWKLDKIDFTTWIVTFLATVFLDIDIGLVCGVLSVLFLNTYRNQNIELLTLGQINETELFSDVKRYDAKEFDNVKIIRPTQSLYYINCDNFRTKLNTICPLKSAVESKSLFQNCKANYSCKSDPENDSAGEAEQDKLKRTKISTIIVDLSLVIFIDESGVKTLFKVFKEYNNENVKILLTNTNDNVREFFIKMDCKWNEDIFLTVKDAIWRTNLQNDLKRISEISN